MHSTSERLFNIPQSNPQKMDHADEDHHYGTLSQYMHIALDWIFRKSS